MGKVFQVKRAGADLDPLFWSFGKIHGLENIAFCDPKEISATGGNPVKLQGLINAVNGPSKLFGSYEELVAETKSSLDAYKEHVNTMGLGTSDRKKLLALPFYLAKRQEAPEPKRGQHEMELFEKMFGQKWFDDAALQRDQETKITEFDYENYFHPDLLKQVDTTSD